MPVRKRVVAYCTGIPVLSGPAIRNLNRIAILDELIVTDTIALAEEARGCSFKIRQLHRGELLGETICRIASASR